MLSSQTSQTGHSRQSDRGVTSGAHFGAEINLACFGVGNQQYALDVAHVREIVRRGEITPLPNAPSLIEGVVELRNNVVPVIDLGRALGQPSTTKTALSRIAIVEVDGMVFGLCVDRATDVLALGPSDLEDPPALATHAGYETVKAVVRRPNSPPVMVLSLEQILESVYRSALLPEGT